MSSVRSHESPLFDFIESCLRNKHEMVIYEAASAIIHLPNCTARELAPAVSGWSESFLSLMQLKERVVKHVRDGTA